MIKFVETNKKDMKEFKIMLTAVFLTIISCSLLIGIGIKLGLKQEWLAFLLGISVTYVSFDIARFLHK